MNTFRQPGNVLELTAPAGGVVSGLPYVIGPMLVVIAATSAAAGERFNGAVVGVFEVPKDTVNDPWEVGQPIWFHQPLSWFTNAQQAGDIFVGHATKPADVPDPIGEVRLHGAPRIF